LPFFGFLASSISLVLGKDKRQEAEPLSIRIFQYSKSLILEISNNSNEDIETFTWDKSSFPM